MLLCEEPVSHSRAGREWTLRNAVDAVIDVVVQLPNPMPMDRRTSSG
jgi:hypothetical protein